MHPMERQKVKNNTGFITAHSLMNSLILEGIDFSKNDRLNKILEDERNQVYLLYPHPEARSLKEYKTKKHDKKVYFIIVDATWPCAKKILRLSSNLKRCTPLTFSKKYLSKYQIKEQPKDGFISTIETAQVILKELNEASIENVDQSKVEALLEPFYKINEYQIECKNDPLKPTYSSRLKNNKT